MAASESAAVLASLVGVTIHAIDQETRTQVASGLLRALSIGEAPAVVVFLDCQDVRIPLPGPHVPSLRFGQNTYIFSMPAGRFMGVVLDQPGANTPADIARFEQVVAANSQLGVAPNPDDPTPDDAASGVCPAAGEPATPGEPAGQSTGEPAAAELESHERLDGVLITRGAAALDAGTHPLPPDEPPAVARALHTSAGFINEATRVVSDGILASAEYVGAGLRATGAAVTERLAPADRPLEVAPAVLANVEYAQRLSGAAVGVSAALVRGVRAMAENIGLAAGGAIAETSVARSLAEGPPNAHLTAVKAVGLSAVNAIDTLFSTLLRAGALVAGSAHEAATGVVTHRYGDQAGRVAADALSTGGNIVSAAVNVSGMGLKTATSVALGTTKALIVASDAAEAAHARQDQLLLVNTPIAHVDGGIVLPSYEDVANTPNTPAGKASAGSSAAASAGASASADGPSTHGQ